VKRTHEASLGTNFGEDTAWLLSGDGGLDAKLAIMTAEGTPGRGGYTSTGYILVPSEPYSALYPGFPHVPRHPCGEEDRHRHHRGRDEYGEARKRACGIAADRPGEDLREEAGA
jgi:hypothetical protein